MSIKIPDVSKVPEVRLSNEYKNTRRTKLPEVRLSNEYKNTRRTKSNRSKII